MSAQTKTPLLDRLDELGDELVQARAVLAQREAERTAAGRRFKAAEDALDTYWEQVEAGDREADEAEEARLQATLAELQASLRPVVHGDGRSGQPTIHYIDARAEQVARGAARAVERAEQAVATFLRVERIGLAAELTGLATEARDAQEAALPALTAAVDADRQVRARWRRLLRANGQPDTLPRSPLRGWDDDLIATGGSVPLPVPASLHDESAKG